MEFDNEMLILHVQIHDCLYDPKSAEYKNRNAKLEAWTNVSKCIIGDTWQERSLEERRNICREVQKRWKSLRDAYYRSRKIREEKGGSGRPYVYEKQMTFLIPVLQSKQIPELVSVDENDVIEYSSPVSFAEKRKSRPSAKRKKNELDQYEFEFLEMPQMSNIPVVQPPAVQYEVALHDDEDKMFLLSLLPHIKDLSATDKLDFKINVMQLIRSGLSKSEIN